MEVVTIHVHVIGSNCCFWSVL